MSVIFDSSGEGAKRTSNIVAGSSDYTCLFYVKFTATPPPTPDYQTAFVSLDSPGTYSQFVGLFRYDDNILYLAASNGVSGTNVASPALSNDVWYRVAYVRQGTTHRFYLQEPNEALTLLGSFTLSFAAVTLGETWIGDDGGFSTEGLEIGYFREWDNDLSITQLLTEFQNLDTSEDNGNLNGNWPLTADLLDDSGLGHDWTAVGSPTFDAAEPAFPANNQRSTAEEIATLPFSDTQDVLINGFAFPVWYKYEVQVDDIVLNLWGYGDALGDYGAYTLIYQDALTFNFIRTDAGGFVENKPVRFSLTQGSTYYIQFRPVGNVALSAADLLIEASLFTNQIAPIGSIFINDDEEQLYFPATFISGVNGDDYNTLHYINDIVVGEGGDVLDNGIILLSDADNLEIVLYNPDFTIITTLPYGIGARRAIRTCQGTQTFFVVSSGVPATAREIDETGAVVDSWVLTGSNNANAVCANNDKTILYHSGNSVDAVKRWDLVNDVALSNFLASVATYHVTDILILSDDSILIGWEQTGVGSDFYINRYDAAGTLLNTYSFGTQVLVGAGVCRMAYAIDQPNSFWVWLHPPSTPGISTFTNIKVSDGSILAEIDAVEYFRGNYGPAETLTPVSRNGPSRSCPFFLTRVAVTTEGTGTLIVRKFTIPSGSVQSFDVEVGGGLSPSSLSMQDGDEETYTEVTAGDGYSVEEVNIPTGWAASYNVSNGSPIDNIEVAADEEVIVTITNVSGGGGVFKVPTVPTNPSTPPARNDDFPQTEGVESGEIIEVAIPTPFFTTALIQDK